jgi:hypothetical protein
MVRSIGGILLGVVGWVAIAILGNWVLRVVLPGYSQVEEAMAFTLPMQIGRLTLGLVSSLGAGALCAVVAGRRRVPPGVLGAIMVPSFCQCTTASGTSFLSGITCSFSLHSLPQCSRGLC